MMKIIKLFIIFLLSLFLVSCNSESDYEKAIKALDNCDYESAIKYLNASLEKEESDQVIDKYLTLAKAYFNNNEYFKGIENILISLKKDDTEKTQDFIESLANGYSLKDVNGVSYKNIIVKMLYLDKVITNLKDLKGKTYDIDYHPNKFHDHFHDDVDAIILEEDKIGDNHKLIYYKHIDNPVCKIEEKNIRGCCFVKDATIEYKDDHINTIKITDDIYSVNNELIETNEYIYSSDLKLIKIISHLLLGNEVLDIKDCVSKTEYKYYNNGNISSIDTVKEYKKVNTKEVEYVNDIARFNEEGLLVSQENYLNNELFSIDSLTYNKENRITNYKSELIPDDYGYFQDFEFSYDYNDEGYLINFKVIDGANFYSTGSNYTLEYNDDYSKVILRNYKGEEDKEYDLYYWKFD